MKSILVTGANKGIGLAVVEAILREQAQYRVILGSRDRQCGESARDSLLTLDRGWSDRLEVLELDVASDQSVAEAKASIAASSGDNAPALNGLVNNAGRGNGSAAEILNVNVYGIHRMCEAFAPLIESGGRIVNVTSASGPNFVARCDAKLQDFFRDPDMTWDRLEQFMRGCQDCDSPYGLSKACANSYTMYLARCHPRLVVNACTPGFINTDLGSDFLGGRTPAEAGMKTPADGARVIMYLLFNQPGGSGHYYGSDALRSPLDHYRAPGAPEYTDT